MSEAGMAKSHRQNVIRSEKGLLTVIRIYEALQVPERGFEMESR